MRFFIKVKYILKVFFFINVYLNLKININKLFYVFKILSLDYNYLIMENLYYFINN